MQLTSTRNLLAIVALCFTQNTFAATHQFNISASITQGSGFSDFAASSVSIANGSASVTLDPGSSGQYLDLQFNNSQAYTTGNFGSDYAVAIFHTGDIIGGTLEPLGTWSTFLYSLTTPPDFSASTSGAIGFRTLSNLFGYINFDWSYSASTKIATLTLNDGFYNDVAGQSIQVASQQGSVPEPATLALMGLGFAGLTARRRKSL